MRKKSIIRYLNKKDIENFTALDFALKSYVSGDLEKILNSYKFTEIEIFPTIKDNVKNLQLYFCYYNLALTIEFNELNYEYCIYKKGASSEEFEKKFITADYCKDFTIETFIGELYKKVCDSEILKRNTNSKSKTKVFTILKILSILIPILFVVIICAYVYITKEKVYMGIWGYLIIIFFSMGYIIFDRLSRK